LRERRNDRHRWRIRFGAGDGGSGARSVAGPAEVAVEDSVGKQTY